MDVTEMQPQARRDAARRELEALAHGGHRSVLLRIQCPNAHHVARVVATAAGPVYETTLLEYAHGDRDRYDGTHHASERGTWTDFLDVGDDPLPAGCECGAATLSRTEVRRQLERGTRRWVMHGAG